MNKKLFVLGIDAIDNQHVAIIDLLDEMSAILKSDDKTKEIACRSHLIRLTNYAATHLGFEEAMMARDGYPGLEAHKRIHNDMIAQLNEIGRKLDQPQLALELNIFLTDWLYNHILKADGAYARYHNSKI